MKIDVLTLFPQLFEPFFYTSILGKAQEKQLVSLRAVNFRDYADNKHHTVDDYPYGGGGGMVLKPEPIFSCIDHITHDTDSKPRIILMCPQGEPYDQQMAEHLAEEDYLVFICGHYEGYDERIRQHLVTDEISIGDFVLTGGEVPAMAVIDSVVRLLPGVLGNEQSAVTDSFSSGLLEYPHYTRPARFREWGVPEVLLSGHHENVAKWRRKQALERTWIRRPDLLEQLPLSAEDLKWLAEIKRKHNQ